MVRYPRLAALMASNGMYKKDLAAVIGKAPSAVSEKLDGNTDFKWAEVITITEFFKKTNPNITSDYIFSATDN